MRRLSGSFRPASSRSSTSMEAAHGHRLTAKDISDAELHDGVHTNFEQKWSGPDGVVIDVSHTGWEGTH